jgi:hypothetical protein
MASLSWIDFRSVAARRSRRHPPVAGSTGPRSLPDRRSDPSLPDVRTTPRARGSLRGSGRGRHAAAAVRHPADDDGRFLAAGSVVRSGPMPPCPIDPWHGEQFCSKIARPLPEGPVSVARPVGVAGYPVPALPLRGTQRRTRARHDGHQWEHDRDPGSDEDRRCRRALASTERTMGDTSAPSCVDDGMLTGRSPVRAIPCPHHGRDDPS